ncbi:MAG: VacJ family lipoprotein [Gammaproteobacteria bacterium]|nr:VacJ family lipoprotein [Gammaproteobacteria bacterium]
MKNISSWIRRGLILCALGTVLLLNGCASVSAPDKRDPWESMNRSIYAFNDGFDRAIARPVAQTYKDYTPNVVQTGVSNFFSNLDDILVTVNDLLQFKFKQAAQDLGRFAFNTTAGLFGLIDVASHMDFPKHNEDFGQTLATWGVGSGPYVMLPFLGPSTLRDTGGLAADWQIDPVYAINDTEARWSVIVLRAVDTRARYLEATKIMEKSGIDPYVFLRNAYLQQRENLIYDGNPPTPAAPKVQPPSKSDLELEQELDKELQLDTPTK